MSEKWIITGGAGYLGSHILDELLGAGMEVLAYDSLLTGKTSRLEYLEAKYKTKIQLQISDIRDSHNFDQVLKSFKPSGVIHTAALKSVSDSFQMESEYFDVNFAATKEILNLMRINNVKQMIFSSTAAIYGPSGTIDKIGEDSETNPISPYGISKLMAEREVFKFGALDGNSSVSLRFFNLVGSAVPNLRDESLENVVPIIKSALNGKESFVIFGCDYPTPDGTCIRDYVDVRDVARAHLKVIQSKESIPPVLNIGTGRGISVREVIEVVCKITGNRSIKVVEGGRRLGDPAQICADTELIERVLNFRTQFTFLESMESVF